MGDLRSAAVSPERISAEVSAMLFFSFSLTRLKQLKWHEGFNYDGAIWPQRLPRK